MSGSLAINDETQRLLRNSEKKRQEPRVDRIEVFQTVWWRAVHAFAFVLGGATFVAGSACYFVPSWSAASVFAGVTYTIGSLGFLTVDLLEFFTFTRPILLRLNIAASALGSLCYVIGSLFFVPVLAAVKGGALVGNWGFIFGSWFIGCSQVFKVARIMRDRTVSSAADRATAVGVEGGACVGAWCFFVGTLLYNYSADDSSDLTAVFSLWLVGSIAFLVGGLFLTFRHAVMGI
jgi:hypothetical protein